MRLLLLDTWLPATAWVSRDVSMTVSKRLREKVEVSHVHNECQISLVIEEKELFLGWKSTVFYRESFSLRC